MADPLSTNRGSRDKSIPEDAAYVGDEPLKCGYNVIDGVQWPSTDPSLVKYNLAPSGPYPYSNNLSGFVESYNDNTDDENKIQSKADKKEEHE